MTVGAASVGGEPTIPGGTAKRAGSSRGGLSLSNLDRAHYENGLRATTSAILNGSAPTLTDLLTLVDSALRDPRGARSVGHLVGTLAALVDCVGRSGQSTAAPSGGGDPTPTPEGGEKCRSFD